MFRSFLIAVVAVAGLLIGSGSMAPPAEAKTRVHVCIGGPCWGGGRHWHNRHWRHHHNRWHDRDFSANFGYGWGYYSDPYFNGYLRPRYVSRGPYHCHIKKRWRHGHRVKVKTCHRAWH